MSFSTPRIPRSRLNWFVLSLASGPIALFVYVLLEWLFFMTKPSMLSGLSFLEQLSILAASPSHAVPVVVLLQVIFSTVSLSLAFRYRAIALVPAAVIIGALIVILFDNFTYVLFGFGIVRTGQYLRLLYVLVVIVAAMGAARLVFVTIESLVSSGRGIAAALIAAALFCGIAPLADWHSGVTTVAAEQGEPAGDSEDPVRSEQSAGSHLTPRIGEAVKHPNVLFLSADGLGAERLSVYGYERETTPFLDELRDEWRFFENAFSNSGHTHGSLLSMLTGKSPVETRVVYPPQMLRGSDAYEHLPGVLRKHGYVTIQLGMRHFADAKDAGAVGAFDFSNYRWEHGTGPALKTKAGSEEGDQPAVRTNPRLLLFRETVQERISSRFLHVFGGKRMVDHHAHVTQELEVPFWNDRKRVEAAKEFIQQTPSPWFMQIHLIDTHCCERMPRNSVFRPVVGPHYDGAGFDGEIRDADEDIREILSALVEAGALDETIVVITSDHTPDWSTIGRIPLLMRFPNAEHAGTVSANAQLIDLPVTVLDYIGLPVPAWMDGDSLIRDLDRFRPIYGVWRVVGTEADSQGQRVLARFDPPFYGIVSATLVTGDQFFELNLPEGRMREGHVLHHTNPSPRRATTASADLLVEMLEANGFGIGPGAGRADGEGKEPGELLYRSE